MQYAIGECNYGGKIIDERDRDVLNIFVLKYLSVDVLKENIQSHKEYVQKINSMEI